MNPLDGSLSFLAEPGAVADWRMVVLAGAAADAGLLDALPGRPADLAARLGLDPHAARVVLDALGALGVVEVGADGSVALAPGAPEGPWRAVLHHHARAVRQWSAAAVARLRGEQPDAAPGGAAMERPDLWQESMATQAREAAPGVADACLARAPGAARMLDVAGGHGEYALAFARRGLAVTLLDLPPIVAIARERGLEAQGVVLFEGDVFEVLPASPFDVVLCAGFTHTMAGARVQALFHRLRPLLAPAGCLAVHTFLRRRHPIAALFAVQMLVNARGGDTHAEEDYRAWLAGAGFAPPDVHDFDGGRRSLLLTSPSVP